MPGIAFYAPLKSPNHPTPSGDRAMARTLMESLTLAFPDHDLRLASELRLLDKTGDGATQDRLAHEAKAEATRLTDTLPSDTAAWVTYHNHYKAPDLIGPQICAARGIPYVLIEASRSRRRLTGPWARFARAAEAACDAAHVILVMTSRDRPALERDRPAGQILLDLPPFLPRDDLPEEAATEGSVMLSAGMMRPGDKYASYRLIAQTLATMEHPDWQLEIAGDGPARPEVEAMMSPFGRRVRFLGQLCPERMARAYDRAALFLWPGVNEAYGMVYLEAQAKGLPVVAQHRPGPADVLTGHYPDPDDGPQALAALADALLRDPGLRRVRGQAGRAAIAARHMRPAAIKRLQAALPSLHRGART